MLKYSSSPDVFGLALAQFYGYAYDSVNVLSRCDQNWREEEKLRVWI